MHSHDAKFHAQYLLQYLTGCERCHFMTGLQQWLILEFDVDTFCYTESPAKPIEAVRNEEESLTLSRCHTSDSCNPNQQDGSLWLLYKLKSTHGWMSLFNSSMYEEGLLWMKRWGKILCARCKWLWLQDVKQECISWGSAGKIENPWVTFAVISDGEPGMDQYTSKLSPAVDYGAGTFLLVVGKCCFFIQLLKNTSKVLHFLNEWQLSELYLGCHVECMDDVGDKKFHNLPPGSFYIGIKTVIFICKGLAHITFHWLHPRFTVWCYCYYWKNFLESFCQPMLMTTRQAQNQHVP